MIRNKILYLLFLVTCITNTNEWYFGDVHVFGDSHSAYSFTNRSTMFPTPNINNWPLICESSVFSYRHNHIKFHIHWISTTMHMIGEEGIKRLDFISHGVREGDVCVLHFGGIDSYHGSIIKQFILGRELDEIVDTLAFNFISAVNDNRLLYNKLIVVIMGLIPPIYLHHNAASYVQRDGHNFNQFIVKANNLLNSKLREYAVANGHYYFDVVDIYSGSNGLLKPELSAGDHHVDPKTNAQIKQRLINLILD